MEYSEGVGGDMDLFHETNGYLIFPTLATFSDYYSPLNGQYGLFGIHLNGTLMWHCRAKNLGIPLDAPESKKINSDRFTAYNS